MARPKKIHNGITTSIFIEKEYHDIAKDVGLSDSELWTSGLKRHLEAVNTRDALEKLLKIFLIERAQIDVVIEKIQTRLGKTQPRIFVRDYEGDEDYEIDEKDYDKFTQRFIRRSE